MSTPAYTEQSLGKRGSEVVTGAVSSKKFAILVAGPQGATISAITCSNKTGAASLIGDLPAGYTTYGNFTALTVTAGAVECYNA
jgi:hypothetical protein